MLRIARTSCDLAAQTGGDAAIPAIIMAVAAAETFINESIVELREMHDESRPFIAQSGDRLVPSFTMEVIFGTLDDELKSVELLKKFQLIHRVLSSTRAPMGTEPWQSFALLIKLRNDLIHKKAEPKGQRNREESAPPESNLLRGLRSLGVINDHDGVAIVGPGEVASLGSFYIPFDRPINCESKKLSLKRNQSLLSMVANEQAPKWAFDTATKVIEIITNILPPGMTSRDVLKKMASEK